MSEDKWVDHDNPGTVGKCWRCATKGVVLLRDPMGDHERADKIGICKRCTHERSGVAYLYSLVGRALRVQRPSDDGGTIPKRKAA